MQTSVVKVDPVSPAVESIRQAAAVIREGRLVAFPTETVYGLGANALDGSAVLGIYEAKRRAPDDPCIVHIAGLNDLARVTTMPVSRLLGLAQRYWPGPLSLVLPRAQAIPDVVAAGRSTVAVRMPDHAVALALIRESGVPIAAPSANMFMHTSPTTAEHVWDDLAGRIDLILDGGPTRIGVESTVLDLSCDVPTVLRPGAISIESLRGVLGPAVALADVGTSSGAVGMKSPGTSPKHYAPSAELMLYDGERVAVLRAMAQKVADFIGERKEVGALVTDEDAPYLDLPGLVLVRLGSGNDLEAVARHLFSALRELDGRGVSVILARNFPPHDIGLAIRDRLTRAAGGRVIRL